MQIFVFDETSTMYSGPVVSKRAWQWSGPVLTAVLVGLVWGTVHFQLVAIANPMIILLLGVTFSALMGGLIPGLVSTAIATGGFVGIVCSDEQLMNLGALPPRVLVNGAVALILAALIAHLRRRIIRAAAEPALREQDVFRGIIRTMHDAIMECDWQGIRDVNPSFCRMTGFAREELVGCRPPFPFWPMEEYARIATMLERAMRGAALDFELVLTRKSGERFPVLLSVSRIADGEAAARVVYSFRDITDLMRAQASREESEMRLKTALAAARMATWDWNLETGMVDGPPRLRELFGLPPGASRSPIDEYFPMIHAEDVGRVRAAIDRTVKEHVPYHISYRISHRDGRVTWLAADGMALAHEDGRPWRITGVVVDVTAEREAGESVRQMEERYRRLFDEAPLGYQSLDADGRLIQVNEAWLRLLGYTREEVIGQSFGEFAAADTAPPFAERFAHFKKVGEVHQVEFSLRHKDGTLRRVLIDGVIARDERGEFRQTHCILHERAAEPRG